MAMMQQNRPNSGRIEMAHLWFLETASFSEPAVAQPWLERLEPHERSRYDACQTDSARRDYLGTRALARTALAHYSGEPPESLRFGPDQHARPELTWPALPRLFFSLSNTTQLAVGLFAHDHNVGVDVEFMAPIGAVEIAGCCFSSEELAELSTLGEDARQSKFYQLWTLRESYLKARGVGLTLPLDQVSFRPLASGSVEATFGPAIRDDPAHWQFGLIPLTAHHLVATCIRRPSSAPPLRIVTVDALAMAADTTKTLPA
jgi:4'-phosphopantetheinyl transferase